MILKNAKIYSDGLIRSGAILINNGVIKSIKYNPNQEEYQNIVSSNKDDKEIDCKEKIIIPGIIDIHSHLRDMGQQEKETFLTGTKAAAFSGITTVFNMPNTKPPAITADQVQNWMDKAKNNIYVDVGFIAGVPLDLNYDEIKRIIDKGVIGLKIYPHSPLSGIDWYIPENFLKILEISSKYQVPIFIHADWLLSESEKEKKINQFDSDKYSLLNLHNQLDPVESEAEYVRFVIKIYRRYINEKDVDTNQYPIIHFCHISCKQSLSVIEDTLKKNKEFNISFEVTPHHLLLSNDIKLDNENIGKVLPPLRSPGHSKYLFKMLKKGEIQYIGTDHAPHTSEEKLKDFFQAPSGFPGFETYPLLLLNEVSRLKLS
ncbi:MAG: dihydroorotase family protein, partial [Candidatus Hermodarchaeota archaeon]